MSQPCPDQQRARAVNRLLDHLDEYRSVYTACPGIGPKVGLGVPGYNMVESLSSRLRKATTNRGAPQAAGVDRTGRHDRNHRFHWLGRHRERVRRPVRRPQQHQPVGHGRTHLS